MLLAIIDAGVTEIVMLDVYDIKEGFITKDVLYNVFCAGC